MRPERSHGFTLIELMTSLGITGILMALITSTFISFDRNSARRNKINSVQSEGRNGMAWLESWVRAASLTVSTGSISCLLSDGATVAIRPSIEVYKGIPGSGPLVTDVKPGTDAILLVTGSGRRTNAAPDAGYLSSTLPLPVGDTSPFVVNNNVLVSDWNQAAWVTIKTINPGVLSFNTTGANIFPIKLQTAQPVVSLATSQLVYVDINDDLIHLTLAVPRMPGATGDILTRERVGRGFMNLQIDVELDGTITLPNDVPTGWGTSLRLIANGLSSGDPISQEAIAALGGGTPMLRMSPNEVSMLRSVALNVAVRSPSPNPDYAGADYILPELGLTGSSDGGVVLDWSSAKTPENPTPLATPGGKDGGYAFVVRSYRSVPVPRTVSLLTY